MAKSKKGARNIVVGDVGYRWRASGNDGYISLVVWPADLPGPAILCMFDYDHRVRASVGPQTTLGEQIVITARIVRRVIEHAVRAHGYDPRAKGPELDLLRVDTLIDVSDALRAS